MKDLLASSLIVVPAYNEEGSLPALLAEIRALFPDTDLLVINDCSEDRTAEVARQAGAMILDLPCNLGVGGAMQACFRMAWERGYQYVIRCDGDGQHPPDQIPKLIEGMQKNAVDLVLGSRFLGEESYRSTAIRSAGIRCLALMLSAICRARVTDPTSGFQMLNRPLLYCFAHSYPTDYPEPESLALMRRQGYTFCEVPTRFRARTAGRSSIRSWDTGYYALKVWLALLVDRARNVDPRYARRNVVKV